MPAVDRLEGDRLLRDRSADVSCCGNHLDYSRSGKPEACLFVKEGELHGAVGREVRGTEDRSERADRAATRCTHPSLVFWPAWGHRCLILPSFSQSHLPSPVNSASQMPWASSSPLVLLGPNPSEPAALKSQITCQTVAWLCSWKPWFKRPYHTLRHIATGPALTSIRIPQGLPPTLILHLP